LLAQRDCGRRQDCRETNRLAVIKFDGLSVGYAKRVVMQRRAQFTGLEAAFERHGDQGREGKCASPAGRGKTNSLAPGGPRSPRRCRQFNAHGMIRHRFFRFVSNLATMHGAAQEQQQVPT
jgi:hypothetical protein